MTVCSLSLDVSEESDGYRKGSQTRPKALLIEVVALDSFWLHYSHIMEQCQLSKKTLESGAPYAPW